MKFFNGFSWIKKIGLVFVVLAVLFGAALLWNTFQPPSEPRWGITFSPKYVRYLGLDAGKAYHAILDDLKVQSIRLPLYWDEIEKTQGTYDFKDVDWYMWDAEKRGLSVTLVIGARSPRWPECHIPGWANLSTATRDRALLAYVEATVNHFKDSSALFRWQVENEPDFGLFGECPPFDRDVFQKELDLVRRLDDRPVQLTVSGEMQSWIPVDPKADVLGVSLYRTTWNRWTGYFTYPWPPAFYRLQAWAASFFVDRVIISELQAEPWFTDTEQARDANMGSVLFTADDLKANAEFARKTGLPEAYFWGAEWWYFMKLHGHPGVWEAAKDIFAGSKIAN